MVGPSLADHTIPSPYPRETRKRQKFLLYTAFLPDMTAAMAASLTGSTSAVDILAGLYQSRYFTERRVGTEYIYQYHPLFREFLRTRATTNLDRDELTRTRRVAASLLEKADRFEDAVDLYAESGEAQEIVRLILTRAPELLQQGRSQTLERWFAHVPAAFYDQEPWLSYWLASCRLATSPLESEAIFEKAFELFKAQGNRAGVLLTLAGIVSSIQFSWIDNSRYDRWVDIMLETVSPDASFPSKEIEIQFTFSMLTALMWRRPQPSLATSWINRAKHIIEEVPDVEKYSFFVGALGNYLTWLGDTESADRYTRTLKSAAESEASPPLMRLVYYANRAIVDWSLGDPVESLRLVEQGLAISRKTGVHVFDVALLAAGAYASLFRNDAPSAERYLKQSAPLVTHPAHVMRANYLYLQAWVLRVKGDLVKAWEFIQEALAVKGLKGSVFSEAQVTYAAADVLHGLGDDRQARRFLNQVRLAGNEMGSFNLRFMVFLLESQFAFDERREEAGLAALGQALAIGRERSFSFLHWFLSKAMARLCAKALEANIEVEYVQKLICKTKLMPVGQASTNAAWPWPVKIRTLGRFEIHVDGQPLPPRRKAPFRILTLLKAIIAFGGQEVSMSRLIDALWPDTEGDAGQETFHKTLQRLRRLLSHDNVIHVRDGKVSLNRQLCWIDAMAFQTLLSGSDDSKPRQPQTDAGGRRYEQAIAMYRGPFLAGDDSYAWVDHSRERLRHQFVQAVQQVSDWKKAEGQEGAAVACLEKGLEADPLAEPIYPRLITFFQASGRQDDAKTVWAQYRQAVVSAGRESSVEMQRLAKNLSSS